MRRFNSQERLNIIKQPIIDWLSFYRIEDLTDMNEQQLIDELIPRITELRRYAYAQNEHFERLLGFPITGNNEENRHNWNMIILTYKEMMTLTIERLGKPF